MNGIIQFTFSDWMDSDNDLAQSHDHPAITAKCMMYLQSLSENTD